MSSHFPKLSLRTLSVLCIPAFFHCVERPAPGANRGRNRVATTDASTAHDAGRPIPPTQRRPARVFPLNPGRAIPVAMTARNTNQERNGAVIAWLAQPLARNAPGDSLVLSTHGPDGQLLRSWEVGRMRMRLPVTSTTVALRDETAFVAWAIQITTGLQMQGQFFGLDGTLIGGPVRFGNYSVTSGPADAATLDPLGSVITAANAHTGFTVALRGRPIPCGQQQCHPVRLINVAEETHELEPIGGPEWPAFRPPLLLLPNTVATGDAGTPATLSLAVTQDNPTGTPQVVVHGDGPLRPFGTVASSQLIAAWMQSNTPTMVVERAGQPTVVTLDSNGQQQYAPIQQPQLRCANNTLSITLTTPSGPITVAPNALGSSSLLRWIYTQQFSNEPAPTTVDWIGQGLLVVAPQGVRIHRCTQDQLGPSVIPQGLQRIDSDV